MNKRDIEPLGSTETVEPMDAQELYERLCEGDPIWLADAVQHAVCNNDLAYLIRQVEKHVPGWVKP
jgi:hypothetical protein